MKCILSETSQRCPGKECSMLCTVWDRRAEGSCTNITIMTAEHSSESSPDQRGGPLVQAAAQLSRSQRHPALAAQAPSASAPAAHCLSSCCMKRTRYQCSKSQHDCPRLPLGNGKHCASSIVLMCAGMHLSSGKARSSSAHFLWQVGTAADSCGASALKACVHMCTCRSAETVLVQVC